MGMDLRRILRHWTTTRRHVRKAFPSSTLRAIECAIKSAEATHSGELRFVAESALDGLPLLQGQTARERAVEVFSQLRVWDTERNCGVLVYLLLADRRLEIVADRGIHACVGPDGWEALSRRMESAFAAGDFERGAIECIATVARHLARHAPAFGPNELQDAPALL